MSKSTHPSDDMTSDTPFAALAGDVTEMQKDAINMMVDSVPQFAGAANLAAHPMGAMAAASAIGMAMASQMFGMFAGAMAGAMQASNMLANETTGGHPGAAGLANPLGFDLGTGSFNDTKEPDRVAKPAPQKADAPKKAKSATVTPIADAKKAAPKTPEAKKVVAKKAEPVKRAEAPAPKAKATPAAKTKAAPVARAKAATETPKTKAAPVAKAKPAAKAKAAPKAKADTKAKPAAAAAEPVALAPVTAKKAAAAPIMPEDFVKPKGTKKPATVDDLKAISGVGPKLESVLNGLGVWTYDQIAAWTPNEVAWVDDFLQFRGRIERDGWIAQAADLAKKA